MGFELGKTSFQKILSPQPVDFSLLPLIILLSAFTGAVVGIALIVVRGRDRNIPIPFGPYLAIAGWIVFFWGEQMLGAYMRFAGLG